MNPQNGYDIEDLSVGMTAEVAKTITDADLVLFAGVSTDVNAVHMDEDFAKTTMFGGLIAHGMLSASLISAVLGNRLPGPGKRLPSTAEMRLADSMPCAIRPLNIVVFAKSSSIWTALTSVDTPANRTRSATVMVLATSALMPTVNSSMS